MRTRADRLPHPPALAAGKHDWDQLANIRHAAAQIGEIQRNGGAKQAYSFISACYRTHGLAATYTKYFESCIAQDYMQSRTLALIYARVPDNSLQKSGSPTAAELMKSLEARMGAAFAQYAIPAAAGKKFLEMVEAKGLPVFMAIVLPRGAVEAAPAQPKDKH